VFVVFDPALPRSVLCLVTPSTLVISLTTHKPRKFLTTAEKFSAEFDAFVSMLSMRQPVFDGNSRLQVEH
jgi:hypothetical protein